MKYILESLKDYLRYKRHNFIDSIYVGSADSEFYKDKYEVIDFESLLSEIDKFSEQFREREE